MTPRAEKTLLRALLYVVSELAHTGQSLPGTADLLRDLRYELDKCGRPECGNGGEHVHGPETSDDYFPKN